MISDLLQKEYDLERETGAYVDGVWTGTVATIQVTGVLQQMTAWEARAYLEGGDDSNPIFKFITGDSLELASSDGGKSDRLLYDGGEFEVISEIEQQSPVQPDWRFVIHHQEYALRQVKPPEGGKES